MRSKWDHQPSCKTNVGPWIISHHTVEEAEPWIVHASYSAEDPTDNPQSVHALNEGWHSQSYDLPLPIIPEFSPAVRIIILPLVKQKSTQLYSYMLTDWINVGGMIFSVWLAFCPFCFLHLAGPPLIYLSILSWGIPSSRKPSRCSSSLLWSSSPCSNHLSSYLQHWMMIVLWSVLVWTVSSGVGHRVLWG